MSPNRIAYWLRRFAAGKNIGTNQIAEFEKDGYITRDDTGQPQLSWKGAHLLQEQP